MKNKISITPAQATTSSVATAGTTDVTVFTLTAGQKGLIQNLAAAALYVKYGVTASSSSFTFILPACTVANDGTSPPVVIDDFVGIVSVAAASGTARYLATVLS